MTGTTAAATTDQQEDFWLMQRAAAEPAAYNVAGVVPVTGPLEIAALHDAVRVLVERSPALRTSLHGDRGRVRAVRWAADASRPRVRAVPGDAAGAAELLADAGRPFDLATPGVLRLTLRSATPERHELLAVSHHAILDGTGLQHLLDDVLAVCGGGRPADRADHDEFAARQVLRRGGDGAADEAFWRHRLAGCAEQAAPLGAAPAAPGPVGLHTVRTELPAAETAAVRGLGASAGVTPFMVLAAALALVTATRAGTPDVVFGLPYDARDEPVPALGTYTGMLPLRVPVPPGPPGRAVRALRNAVLDALTHPAVSLTDLMQVCDDAVPWRVIVNGLTLAAAPARPGALAAGAMTPISTGAKADLTVTVVDDGSRLRLIAVAPGARAPRDAVVALLADVARTVRRLTGLDPEQAGPPPPEASRELWDAVWTSPVDGPNVLVRPGSHRFAEADVAAFRQRILQLAGTVLPERGGRVLEVGCGGGQITAGLAPGTARYVAVDPSAAALRATGQRLAGVAGAGPVELVQAFAHELPGRLSGPFDLVLLAGVVQFFPDTGYLADVLGQLVRLLRPGGAVLVADVVGSGSGQFDGCLPVDAELFRAVADRPEVAGVDVLTRTDGELPEPLLRRYDVLIRAAGTRPVAAPAAPVPGPAAPVPGPVTPVSGPAAPFRGPAPSAAGSGTPPGSGPGGAAGVGPPAVPAAPDLARIVAEAVTEVIGRPVGTRDDLFQRGGTSISAAAVVALVRERCGVRLRVRDFFSGTASPERVAGLALERHGRSVRAGAGGGR